MLPVADTSNRPAVSLLAPVVSPAPAPADPDDRYHGRRRRSLGRDRWPSGDSSLALCRLPGCHRCAPTPSKSALRCHHDRPLAMTRCVTTPPASAHPLDHSCYRFAAVCCAVDHRPPLPLPTIALRHAASSPASPLQTSHTPYRATA